MIGRPRPITRVAGRDARRLRPGRPRSLKFDRKFRVVTTIAAGYSRGDSIAFTAQRSVETVDLIVRESLDHIELVARYPPSFDMTECPPPIDERGDFYHHEGRIDIELTMPEGVARAERDPGVEMSERRIPVFFYGLFMDAELLRGKGVDPQNIRRASLPGFALRIGQRATLVPDANGRAHGIAMDLTHAEIDGLYAEPGVSMYRAEPVLLETETGPAAALCFVLPVPPQPDERNDEYAAKLRDLSSRLGLPVTV